MVWYGTGIPYHSVWYCTSRVRYGTIPHYVGVYHTIVLSHTFAEIEIERFGTGCWGTNRKRKRQFHSSNHKEQPDGEVTTDYNIAPCLTGNPFTFRSSPPSPRQRLILILVLTENTVERGDAATTILYHLSRERTTRDLPLVQSQRSGTKTKRVLHTLPLSRPSQKKKKGRNRRYDIRATPTRNRIPLFPRVYTYIPFVVTVYP